MESQSVYLVSQRRVLARVGCTACLGVPPSVDMAGLVVSAGAPGCCYGMRLVRLTPHRFAPAASRVGCDRDRARLDDIRTWRDPARTGSKFIFARNLEYLYAGPLI
jgi:hypothetical protein